MAFSQVEITERILEIKKAYGSRLFIPAHHYMRDEIVRLADCTGDSLELSRAAAATDAEYIVFCGVRFMAETARVLSEENKRVFMPRPDAGCPLADLGSLEEIEPVWKRLESVHPGEYVPVTYVNSSVELKSFCGSNGGFACTSSNAKRIFQAILEQKKRVFFMPDRNLGINTAYGLGLEDDYEVVGVNGQAGQIEGRRIAVWDGFCYVHRAFIVDQIAAMREKHPGIKVIVHPECDPEVVKDADITGSTSQIKRYIEQAASTSRWAVGTELRFVTRLQHENDDKVIEPLFPSLCGDMSKSGVEDLLHTLELIEKGDYTEQILVSPEAADGAMKAIVRMLEAG